MSYQLQRGITESGDKASSYGDRVYCTSEKSAHAHSELENVKKPTVMGTKYASKKVEVNRVYF